jgi:hypothetical protein
MKIQKNKLIPRTSFVIFLLFFGIATLEGIRSKNWIAVGYWALIAITFLVLDSGKNTTDWKKESY